MLLAFFSYFFFSVSFLRSATGQADSAACACSRCTGYRPILDAFRVFAKVEPSAYTEESIQASRNGHKQASSLANGHTNGISNGHANGTANGHGASPATSSDLSSAGNDASLQARAERLQIYWTIQHQCRYLRSEHWTRMKLNTCKGCHTASYPTYGEAALNN